MNIFTFLIVFMIIMSSRRPVGALRDFTTCHDDFSLKPPDGMLKKNSFSWLAFVQYTHVTTGLPHHSKAPRVVLIHKQFVIGTALDLLHLPKNYKLGNVIFGEYEREEEECGMTRSQLKMGGRCPHAYLETPLLDIIPHPEYSRFGVGNSLALVKLLRPMKSNVPRDFNAERMGKKTLKLFTHKECRRHRLKASLGSEGVTHVLCSSGCGVRPGAPIASQNSDGGFELIGVAAGGAPCAKRAMRRRLIKEPPLYIDVFPYTTWIINVITANILPLPYPQNFRRTESGTSMGIHKNYLRKKHRGRGGQRHEWRARAYVSGQACFDRGSKAKENAFFYSERFEVNADPPAKLTIYLKISAGIECTITCARLLLPNRLVTPEIEGVGGYNISIKFSSDWFPYTFYYSLGLSGRNTSEHDMGAWYYERQEGRFW